jgi:multidrug efflux pump subunit AcrB
MHSWKEEPVNPSADQSSTAPATNPGLPKSVQILVAILGSVAAFLVAVEGIPKLFPSKSDLSGSGSGTAPGSASASALQSEAEEIAKKLFAQEYDTVRAKFSPVCRQVCRCK